MFDDVTEEGANEREIRRIRREQLFRRPKPRLPDKHKGDVMERRVIHGETKVATLDQMRAAAEALKGVNRACDITQAKPEFVEFIRKCSPASILAVLNQHATLTEQRDRLTRMLANVIDANYGTSYHHIGDGDGMPEEQAREIQEWWQAYLQQVQRDYQQKRDEQGGGGL